MTELALRACRIARERDIPQADLEGWSVCLDLAWKEIADPRFHDRRELARWCNDPKNQRRN